MVSRNEPMESLVNNMVNGVREMFIPVELSVRNVAKGLGSNLDMSFKRNGAGSNGKVEVFTVKGKRGECFVGSEKKKGLSVKVPIKMFLGFFMPNCGNSGEDDTEVLEKDRDATVAVRESESCTKCLQFAMTWTTLVDSVVQAFPSQLKYSKSRDKASLNSRFEAPKSRGSKKKETGCLYVEGSQEEGVKHRNGKNMPLECLIGAIFDQLLLNIQKFDQNIPGRGRDSDGVKPPSHENHLEAVAGFMEGRKAVVDGFLGNLGFAKVGGVPSSMVEVPPGKEVGVESGDLIAVGQEDTGDSTPQKQMSGILSIPFSNVGRLRSTLSTVTLAELIELVPYLGRSSQEQHPDKKKLISVQDFFRYTESEGRRFFEELDRDSDGQVTLEDLEIAMRKRKLPGKYAREFMSSTRSHLFSKSFGWKQFLSFMEQKEPTILRAYTSLCLSKSGTLQKSEILASLKNAGLPANEDNAVAMMRFLNVDTEQSISYGHFRNFMLLLPSDRLKDDPRNIWFEAATVVAVAPPVEIPTGSVLKSALAGGLACALSTSLMFPMDTIKTRVQASSLTFPEMIAKLPQIGSRGLYRGSVPAIIGQFSSHGLRTGIFEATKLVLINVAPNLPEFQVQSVSSFVGTFLGTAIRIPCEVLKQRLQAGIFDNVGEAIVGTWKQDGLRGFFRGTGATLCREVPFYVAGMGLYAESKKVVQHLLGRELEPWETILVGAVSGGLASVVTTPFDVMKTRMMTAPGGRKISMSLVAFSILRHEGPLGLFKGAVPRFFWIAPLGAMNFAGYELAKKAMDKKNEEAAARQLSQKKLVSSG